LAQDSAQQLAALQAGPLAAVVAEQYAQGVMDLENGYPDIAVERFAWIVETVQAPPELAQDSAQLLATARAAVTLTPAITSTPCPTPNISTATPVETPAPDEGLDPAYLYDQAATMMRFVRYEEAIEWLEALQALAPDYRAAEVQAMYLEALVSLARTYLRGQNEDGSDMLARGVLLAYRAAECGDSSLVYEADFVERYLNARNYVNGDQDDKARPVLSALCQENCSWGYGGVSVCDLYEQVGGNCNNP
jgi:tetratricopeptide (TPR) repeat protein